MSARDMKYGQKANIVSGEISCINVKETKCFYFLYLSLSLFVLRKHQRAHGRPLRKRVEKG